MDSILGSVGLANMLAVRGLRKRIFVSGIPSRLLIPRPDDNVLRCRYFPAPDWAEC